MRNAGFGVTGVAAGRNAAEVALPPSALATNSVTAAVPSAANVHDTVMEVAETTVAAPQVPPLDGVTETPAAKPVPVMVRALVELGVAVAGETLVTVGAAPIANAPNWKAATVTLLPLVLVTV